MLTKKLLSLRFHKTTIGICMAYLLAVLLLIVFLLIVTIIQVLLKNTTQGQHDASVGIRLRGSA